jgi:hypothetical protein
MAMTFFKKVLFFEEKNYEIRVFRDDKTINIVTFRNNYPINGFRHQIKISKSIAIEEILKQKVIDELIEICKKDISEKRWERLTAIK